MTHTTNTSKKAMQNAASTEEETYTEEGATAILTRDIFWFFMTDNEFIAKTINDL